MMWVIVVQHEDNVTRVLGPYDTHAFALSAVDQYRKDQRGFVFSVHPLLNTIPTGQGSVE
jgi:hypothetical protein